MKTIVSLSDLQKLFPNAFCDLLSGEWEDNDGRPVTTLTQAQKWLEGDEFYTLDGKLHWVNVYEGDQVWNSVTMTWDI